MHAHAVSSGAFARNPDLNLLDAAPRLTEASLVFLRKQQTRCETRRECSDSGSEPCGRMSVSGFCCMFHSLWVRFSVSHGGCSLFCSSSSFKPLSLFPRSLSPSHVPLLLLRLLLPYRGTSLARKRTPLGRYRNTMPRVLGGSQGGWAFSHGRSSPVHLRRTAPRIKRNERRGLVILKRRTHPWGCHKEQLAKIEGFPDPFGDLRVGS